MIGATVLSACCGFSAKADAVRILHADKDAAQARVDLVQQARREIQVAYYTLGDDDFALMFLALLRDAARRGVAVRLIVDGGGANNLMPRALQYHLLGEKIEIREFHPPAGIRLGWIGHRMHDKLLIVDGHQWITGGRNMRGEYFGRACQNFLDRDVYLRGAMAAEAACYFLARWNGCDVLPTRLEGKLPRKLPRDQEHPELNDGCDDAAVARAGALLDEARRAVEKSGFVRFDTGRDWSAGAREASRVDFLHDLPGVPKRAGGIGSDMLDLLSGAQCSVVIETPYAAFSREMLGVLAGLRRRGVSVTLLTNSFETTNQRAVQADYENHKRWFLRRGIELWELRGGDHLHAKAAIVDGTIAVIGSYNFDVLSESRNSEVAVAIHDPQVAASLLDSFESHRERAYQIGRNARPLGYNTRYPGSDRQDRREMRVKRAVAPFIRSFL